MCWYRAGHISLAEVHRPEPNGYPYLCRINTISVVSEWSVQKHERKRSKKAQISSRRLIDAVSYIP